MRLIALTMVIWVLAGCAGHDSVIERKRADLDNDGTVETVTITCRSIRGGHPVGGEIVVCRPSNGRLIQVWRQPRLNPWKLRIGDVDGDGKREIVAGVWKKSPRDPVMAKRVFVYSWNGKRMLPKWLVSRLSRRFDDFDLIDVNHDRWDEIVALEVAPKGKHRVAVYRWKSFGFEFLGQCPTLNSDGGCEKWHARSGYLQFSE